MKTRNEAVRLRRKGEKTIKVTKHKPLCLYSDGTIIPPYPCTCGSKTPAYFNVLR